MTRPGVLAPRRVLVTRLAHGATLRCRAPTGYRGNHVAGLRVLRVAGGGEHVCELGAPADAELAERRGEVQSTVR